MITPSPTLPGSLKSGFWLLMMRAIIEVEWELKICFPAPTADIVFPSIFLESWCRMQWREQ